MKKEVRWRKVPTRIQRIWMRRRCKLTGRTQADILGEVLRLGQKAFDARYKLGRAKISATVKP